MKRFIIAAIIACTAISTQSMAETTASQHQCVFQYENVESTKVCVGDEVLNLGFVYSRMGVCIQGAVVGKITSLTDSSYIEGSVARIEPWLMAASDGVITELTPYKAFQLRDSYNSLNTEYIAKHLEKRIFKIQDEFYGIRKNHTVQLEGKSGIYRVEVVADGALLLRKTSSWGFSSDVELTKKEYEIHTESISEEDDTEMIGIIVKPRGGGGLAIL